MALPAHTKAPRQRSKSKTPSWQKRGFDSPAEARQYERSRYGTNSSRQKSRYNDAGPSEVISAREVMRMEESRAAEHRLFELRQTINVEPLPGWKMKAEILSATVDRNGGWVYETDCGYQRSITQAEALKLNPRANMVQTAFDVVEERETVLALKRGSRRDRRSSNFHPNQ